MKMLTEEEIRRIAKRRNMSVGLTEKDYVIEWLLKGIYESNVKDNLIFKGGTAIKKVYFQETWRFSHDLDFTALNSDRENTRNQLEGVFRDIEGKSAIKLVFEFKSELIFDEDKLRDARRFWEVGLKDLVKELPDFGLVTSELRNKLEKL